MTAPIIATDRLRVTTDGTGITTLVCFQGCPLRCQYCLNPFTLKEGTPHTLMTPAELYEKTKVDALYFEATGGGITFGGGEPLLRAEFIREFRKICGNTWHLTAETSLAVPREQVEIAAECTDEFMVDIKDPHPHVYRAYTGKDGRLALENLERLLALTGPERIVVRLPLIPGFNTPQLREESLEKLKSMGLCRFDLFQYKTNP